MLFRSKLKTLWCQNNKLTRLGLGSLPLLESILIDGNEITRVATTTMTNLADFWCDNNVIESLDLSSSTKLTTFSCNNNGITSLAMPKLTSMDGFYADNNFVGFSSMFSTQSAKSSTYGESSSFTLPESEVNVGVTYSGLATERYDAAGKNVGTVYRWETPEGTVLTSGTASSGRDYRQGSGTFQFHKGFNEIYCYMTSTSFPGLTVKSTALRVIDPTSIDNITQQNGFTYNIVGNSIQMTAEKNTPVSIYTTDGKLVWSGVVTASGSSAQLHSGLYIVNGIKVRL